MKGLIGIIAIGLCVTWCGWLTARTWHVAPSPLGSDPNPGTATEPSATVQKGIDAARDGDTIIVAQGTCLENIHFNGKNIILRGTDPLDPDVVANAIVDGDQAGSVVTFSSTENETCTLSGFTIRNGSAVYGGGVYGGTWATALWTAIQNNTITGNSAHGEVGGLGYCIGTTLKCIIWGNAAPDGAQLRAS